MLAASAAGAGVGGEASRVLEGQLGSALALRSEGEVRRWLPLLAMQLGKEGALSRLRELLQGLLGPPGGEAAGAGWAPSLLGMSKRELLQQVVLPQLAQLTQLPCQRLVGEFNELCSAAEEEEAMVG